MAEQRFNALDDRALFEAIKEDQANGDPFRELHRRYHGRVLGFFIRRGFGRETGLDLSQETFFRVYQGIRDFRGEVPLASWIFRIAANIAKNEIRRRHATKRQGVEEPLEDLEQSNPKALRSLALPSDESAPPLARTLAKEQIEALGEALETLPPQMQRTLRLSIVHRYGVTQIADLMQVSPSTVKVQLHLGRKKLRRALTERFGELAF